MTTSPMPMVGVEEDANWQTAQTEDVKMRDPGAMTGKRTRNDQSPEEERGREAITRSIKQEMIEESPPMQAERVAKRQNEVIDLTNTDEESETSEGKEEDLGKEDSSEESSDDLYGNENSNSSEGSNGTSSKEDVGCKKKTEVQDSDKSSSEESHSDVEIQVIAVTSP